MRHKKREKEKFSKGQSPAGSNHQTAIGDFVRLAYTRSNNRKHKAKHTRGLSQSKTFAKCNVSVTGGRVASPRRPSRQEPSADGSASHPPVFRPAVTDPLPQRRNLVVCDRIACGRWAPEVGAMPCAYNAKTRGTTATKARMVDRKDGNARGKRKRSPVESGWVHCLSLLFWNYSLAQNSPARACFCSARNRLRFQAQWQRPAIEYVVLHSQQSVLRSIRKALLRLIFEIGICGQRPWLSRRNSKSGPVDLRHGRVFAAVPWALSRLHASGLPSIASR